MAPGILEDLKGLGVLVRQFLHVVQQVHLAPVSRVHLTVRAVLMVPQVPSLLTVRPLPEVPVVPEVPVRLGCPVLRMVRVVLMAR